MTAKSLRLRIANNPLRAKRSLTDHALQRTSGLLWTLFADTGSHSTAPEKLPRAQVMQLFYSVRSERLLMEQLRQVLRLRWFSTASCQLGLTQGNSPHPLVQ